MQGVQPVWRVGETATGLKRRSGHSRGEPARVAELSGRTGGQTGWPGQRSDRPGTLTPEWWP
jgi:hypothetical protein